MAHLNEVVKYLAVNLSPGLGAIALAIRGDAGLFRVASGTQVMPFARLRGTCFADDTELYAATWRDDGSPAPMQKVDSKSGSLVETWLPTAKPTSNVDAQVTIQDTHFSGPVLLVHEQSSFYVSSQGGIQYPGHKRRSELRALDLKSGRKVWSKQWEGDPPVPYADPQGDRVALGWRPTMSGG